MGRCEIIVEFLARSGSLDCSLWLSLSKVGHFRTSHVSRFSSNYLMWRKAVLRWKMTTHHPCRETGYQGHELFGLDGASIRGCKDLHGSTSTTRRCGVNFEGLDAKAGWIQEDESKLLLRKKAPFSVERGKDESLRQYTTIRLAQIGAASAAALVTMPTTTWGTVLKEGARLSKQSEQNLHTLLNGSTELDDVARALNMLDVESQAGIIKAAVKPVVHSFMETGKFSESQPCEEETDEPNDQSDEEEELCPPLEETMAASWIAQIGEEGQRDRGGRLLHCHERAAQTNLGPGPGTQEGGSKGSRILLITCRSSKSSEWFSAAATVNASIFDFQWTETGHRKIFVLDCAGKTCVFAAKRMVTGRLNARRSNTTRMELLLLSFLD